MFRINLLKVVFRLATMVRKSKETRKSQEKLRKMTKVRKSQEKLRKMIKVRKRQEKLKKTSDLSVLIYQIPCI